MDTRMFDDFMAGDDTLRIFEGDTLVFSSKKARLLPLLDYLAASDSNAAVTVYDKVVGNAAALLSVKAHAAAVYSPLGSEIAAGTLDGSGITHGFTKTVPYITQADCVSMCPMEKLSIGKEPEEFYRALVTLIEDNRPPDPC